MHELIEQFTLLDRYAFGWFLLSWIGYSLIADQTRLNQYSISTTMAKYRREWIQQMLRREIRIIDAQLHSNMLHNIGFFATTTILAIGGSLALLGATDQAILVMEDLPYMETNNRVQWEFKILLLVLIFIYAFFKFAWAFRLANWNSILFGAAPPIGTDDVTANDYVDKATRLNRLSSNHFNRGIRAYFFALAELSWFLDARLFIISTGLVLMVLINREFRTRFILQL
ncbi:MAG: putative membrane protein [Parasphingorhabdus sp.]|jgi:uncharacterized membrane protein